MPGAAFSPIGGTQAERTLTGYLVNVTGEQPMERPGMADKLFVRNPSARPMLRFTEELSVHDTGWDDYWRWKEDARLSEVGALAGSLAISGVALTVDDGNLFTVRDILMVGTGTTGTFYYCQVDTLLGDVMTVTWIGDAPPAALPVDTPVVKIGTAYRQIDEPYISPSTRTAEFWNGWQHMLTGYKASVEADNMNAYFEPEVQRQIRKADDSFDELREKTYIWGQRSLTYIGANNMRGTLRGLWNWAGHIEDLGGAAPTLADFSDFVQGWCTGNIMDGERRICLCPLNLMRHINDVAMDNLVVQTDLGDTVPKTWGIEVKAYTIAGKTINFVYDPMFDLHGWHDKMLGFNMAPEAFGRRYKRGPQGPKHNKAHIQPYGIDEFVVSGHISSQETLEVKWSAKNVWAMTNVEVLAAALL
jgi:hypothetical protein